MPGKTRFWAVIPAAGVGARMQSDMPKQYLQLGGKSIIEYAVEVFLRHDRISGVVVAISANDNYWKQSGLSGHEKVLTVTGGIERCHSVLNSLDFLAGRAAADDWVLVHDAARPCIRREEISTLMDELSDDAVGGLLALPVRDTMKRASDDNRVTGTVNREGLWHALTPQMFRLQDLATALHKAIRDEKLVTDEAQAMELSGYQPRLVEGNPRNIKITRMDDLALAEMYLEEMNS